MKNTKVEAIVKMMAFDFHLLAVLVMLFVFSVGVHAIARTVSAEHTGEARSLYLSGR